MNHHVNDAFVVREVSIVWPRKFEDLRTIQDATRIDREQP